MAKLPHNKIKRQRRRDNKAKKYTNKIADGWDRVTDHAVLRYMERIMLWDIEHIRALVEEELDGLDYIEENGHIVTVLGRKK